MLIARRIDEMRGTRFARTKAKRQRIGMSRLRDRNENKLTRGKSAVRSGDFVDLQRKNQEKGAKERSIIAG